MSQRRTPAPDPTPDLFALPAPPAPPPPTSPAQVPLGSDGGGMPLAEFAERAYLAYAMSVVKGRALPAVEDGQKPVQRRILFAMREMGNRADQPFRKSARIVGDVIGKYHPHGDVAVYEAAVRMAQSFTLRYPLIQGQGNFGSRDGDAPAAMRYTEVRLSRFAEDILLSELDRGTVDFRDNYDGSMREPVLLPARLPVLLLNGASGIAVGMATDIPPHNLREVCAAAAAVVANPDIADAALLAHVPAPDFPGGGQIISSSDEIARALASGRGSLRVRARWTVEPLARGQYRIAVTQLPPNTSAARILLEIEDLTNPKARAGKKSLSPEQQSLRAAALAVLDGARDDSDQEHPVRLVLEPRSSRVTPDELMALLLANTSLEGNCSINLVVIGRDGKPQQKGLPLLLREWAQFRLAVVERRLAFRLNEVERRIHILEGRMIAFLNIDQVIRVIRNADEPKPELIAQFSLTDAQAEDILEIRLRQLARLEGIRIEKELKALATEGKDLRRLLRDESARRELVVQEITADAQTYGDARRTLVEAAEKVTASRVDTLVDEPITLILSRNGFIRQRSGHGIDRSALTWKEGDGALAIAESRSVHPIVLFASNGRVFGVRAADLPGGKGDGVPVSSLIDLQGTRIVGMHAGPAASRVLLATSSGYALIAPLSEMVTRQRIGKQFVTVDDGATLLPVSVLSDTHQELAALSGEGRLLVFPLAEMKVLAGGGKGVQVMALRPGESLLAVVPVTGPLAVRAQGRGDRPQTIELTAAEVEHCRGHRARTGRQVPGKWKRVLGLA